MYNAQVAMIAACAGEGELREADIEPRAAAYMTWLQAQVHDTAQHVSDAQAALLAAANAWAGTPELDPTSDVTAHAAVLLVDIQALAGYPGFVGG